MTVCCRDSSSNLTRLTAHAVHRHTRAEEDAHEMSTRCATTFRVLPRFKYLWGTLYIQAHYIRAKDSKCNYSTNRSDVGLQRRISNTSLSHTMFMLINYSQIIPEGVKKKKKNQP